jgi:hypothetical protein
VFIPRYTGNGFQTTLSWSQLTTEVRERPLRVFRTTEKRRWISPLAVSTSIQITGGAEFRISGTSQATPIVTMTAALLYSLGLKSPQDVRERILSTVEPLPALIGKVRFEGSLDVNKALAISTDIVERGNPVQTLRGTVKPFSLSVEGENGPVDFTDLRRVFFNFPSAGVHRVWLVKPHRLGDARRLRIVDSKLDLTKIELKTSVPHRRS